MMRPPLCRTEKSVIFNRASVIQAARDELRREEKCARMVRLGC